MKNNSNRLTPIEQEAIMDRLFPENRQSSLEARSSVFLLPGEKIIDGIIKSECNLARLPLTVSCRDRFKTMEICKTGHKIVDGKRINLSWKMMAHQKYGMPNDFDEAVLVAIEHLWTEQGILTHGLVPFTYYRLCKIMGVDPKKRVGEVRASVRRWIATVCSSEGMFRIKDENGRPTQVVRDEFHIIDRVVEKSQTLPDGTTAETNYLVLGTWYLQSILSGYYRPLDSDFFFSLQRPLSRKLYRRLSMIFFAMTRDGEEAVYRRHYRDFCEDMAITAQEWKAHAVKVLRPALDELVERRFLRSYEFQDSRSKAEDFLVVLFPGQRVVDPDTFDARQEHFAFEREDSRARHTKLPPPSISEDTPAYRLVAYFHARAGRPDWPAKKKEIGQAQALLDAHGEEKARAIIDFAFEEAPKTKFDMKFFGAILSFVDQHEMHLEADYKARQARKAREVALSRARDVAAAREALVFGKLAAFRKQLGEEAWQERVDAAEKRVLAENPMMGKFKKTGAVTRLAENEVKREAIKELGLPSLEEYAAGQGVDPALLKEIEK
jgi:hypothetical protein